MCKVKVDINYCGTPKAFLSFGGVENDVFSELSPAQQRKIKKSYDMEIEVSIPVKIIRTVFREEWKENLRLRRKIRRLPLHRVTVPWKVLK